MAEDDGDGIVDLLGDDYARTILRETYGDTKSVETLSEACDADSSTVYRRIQRLRDADLIEDEQQLDPGGHHYKTYRASVEAVHLELSENGFEISIDRPEPDAADRFTRLYEGFK
ncbi:winged helix-turn-helix domain-containing protein [Halobaculum marinum]|uniref:Helix-turn-helix domain-containing protein n=1 Tax=Halobaculum marinum TaxID=3031996 RepID=A0ABD5WVQ0_9EURY|nr:helix-turn-helix domain-containing protein [Halobaculum sp. DT55]